MWVGDETITLHCTKRGRSMIELITGWKFSGRHGSLWKCMEEFCISFSWTYFLILTCIYANVCTQCMRLHAPTVSRLFANNKKKKTWKILDMQWIDLRKLCMLTYLRRFIRNSIFNKIYLKQNIHSKYINKWNFFKWQDWVVKNLCLITCTIRKLLWRFQDDVTISKQITLFCW